MDLLSQSDLVNSVREIQRAGSDLKLLLYRSHLKGETAWKPKRDEYIAKVYSFVNTWKEYAQELQDDMKHASGAEGIRTIKQNAVRSYLYTSYDYASILPYVDGVFRAIKKNEFDNPRDFEDFWKYTVQKAFKGRADSIGGLVEEVLSLQAEFSDGYKSSIADAKMFDAVKHQQIFKPTDSRDLYKSIEKAIEFIFYSDDDGMYNYPEGEMMQVAVINSIIDYATYSMAAYATRVYAVALYANPFIQNDKSFSEAVYTFGPKVGVYSVMKETDEGMARDFRRLPEYVEKLESFLTEIGIHDEIEGARDDLNNPGHQWRAEINKNEGNQFNAALMSNPLRELSFGYLGMAWVQELTPGERLHQVSDVLRDCLYNGRVAYGDTSTPKNELLAAIARVKPEKKTLEAFQKLGSDLVKFCGAMLYSIYDLIRNYMDHEVEPKSYWDKKGSIVRDEQEIVTMLNDLYKDIAVALLYRARAIEEKINHIRISDRERSEDLLTIKVPGGLHRKGNGLAHAMAPIVPVTQRIPLEVINLYATPYSDKLDLYDEYAKTLLPGDPYYFKEDGEENLWSKIKNAIIGFFKRIVDAVGQFAGNASFKAASEWVKKHRSELESLTPVPPITVKDYADKIKIDDFSGTIDHLKTHFTKEVLTDKTKFEAFKTGLYESRPELLALINNKELGSDKVALAYKNHILFNKPVAPGSAVEVPEVELTSDSEISRRLHNWIITLVDAPETVDKFAKLMKTYQSTVQDCLNKNEAWSKEIRDASEKVSSGGNPPTMESVIFEDADEETGVDFDSLADHSSYQNPESKVQSTPKTENKPKGNHSDLSNEVLKEMQSCFRITIAPAYYALQEAIRDEYKYIQEVYYGVKGKKKEESE